MPWMGDLRRRCKQWLADWWIYKRRYGREVVGSVTHGLKVEVPGWFKAYWPVAVLALVAVFFSKRDSATGAVEGRLLSDLLSTLWVGLYSAIVVLVVILARALLQSSHRIYRDQETTIGNLRSMVTPPKDVATLITHLRAVTVRRPDPQGRMSAFDLLDLIAGHTPHGVHVYEMHRMTGGNAGVSNGEEETLGVLVKELLSRDLVARIDSKRSDFWRSAYAITAHGAYVWRWAHAGQKDHEFGDDYSFTIEVPEGATIRKTAGCSLRSSDPEGRTFTVEIRRIRIINHSQSEELVIGIRLEPAAGIEFERFPGQLEMRVPPDDKLDEWYRASVVVPAGRIVDEAAIKASCELGTLRVSDRRKAGISVARVSAPSTPRRVDLSGVNVSLIL